MKSNKCTKQGNTRDPESNALNPAGSHEKTWGWFAIINIWADDVHLLFGYMLVFAVHQLRRGRVDGLYGLDHGWLVRDVDGQSLGGPR